MRALEQHVVFVPFSWFVNLLERRNCPVNSAGQLGILGLRIVSEIRHLQFHAVESRIAVKRGPQCAAAVARLAELEFEFEFEVAVFLFAEQPTAARLAAVQHTLLDLPNRVALGRIAHVVPGAHDPTLWHAVFGKQCNELRLGSEESADCNPDEDIKKDERTL